MLHAASDRRNDISRHGGGDRRLQAVAGPDVRQTPGPPRPSRAGAARLASLIAKREAALAGRGPVLVLDAGDYSMGTEFATSTRETGGELKLMSRVGYVLVSVPLLRLSCRLCSRLGSRTESASGRFRSRGYRLIPKVTVYCPRSRRKSHSAPRS